MKSNAAFYRVNHPSYMRPKIVPSVGSMSSKVKIRYYIPSVNSNKFISSNIDVSATTAVITSLEYEELLVVMCKVKKERLLTVITFINEQMGALLLSYYLTFLCIFFL